MKDEEKKNPIKGDSLKVERNDSLFFCALLGDIWCSLF